MAQELLHLYSPLVCRSKNRYTQVDEAFMDAPHIPEIQTCCIGHREMQLGVLHEILP